MKAVSGLVGTLPVYSQHLLVLLFGTFRIIAANSQAQGTNMTAQALGVSVAPSFFHTCVTSGKTARMEDVERFKDATTATSYIIDNFGMRDLFGRENYEYYARLTGRILKVEDEWIFFTYPPGVYSAAAMAGGLEKTGSLEIIPENCPLDPAGRLSISLDDQNLSSGPSSCGSPPGHNIGLIGHIGLDSMGGTPGASQTLPAPRPWSGGGNNSSRKC